MDQLKFKKKNIQNLINIFSKIFPYFSTLKFNDFTKDNKKTKNNLHISQVGPLNPILHVHL